MDDSVRPVSLPHCLSDLELNRFLDLIDVAVDRIGNTLVVVYAEVGPVAWIWDDTLLQFCVVPIR
jgi:hypothetical protein